MFLELGFELGMGDDWNTMYCTDLNTELH